MFIFNGVLMYENSSPLHKFCDRLIEERKELIFLIGQSKGAIWHLKKWNVSKPDIYELYHLREYLEDISVECDEISILIYEYNKLK